jgi:hypothetical protein
MPQDSGQWRHAAILAASQLSSSELGGALERWAMHVVSVEGCLWRGLGLLTAGGCCKACVRCATMPLVYLTGGFSVALLFPDASLGF